MPCYDKKLEAIRFDIEEGVKEVDITITTTELQELYSKIQGYSIGESNK
jgi:iron only hydrogenase large subunit-like protein